MNYILNKKFIPRESLSDQLIALKKKLLQHEQAWADTQPTKAGPFDNDDLDEIGGQDAPQD